jgi:hypothetical protein
MDEQGFRILETVYAVWSSVTCAANGLEVISRWDIGKENDACREEEKLSLSAFCL